MGLLDDAIRDHLELKRLRGADPGEVAREQKEALDPAFEDENVAGPQEVPSFEEDLDPAADRGDRTPVRAPDAAPQPTHGVEVADLSQETSEFDVQTVMDTPQGAPSEHDGPDGSSPRGSHSIEGRDEESLEWEIPGDSFGEIA
jgi:hypothetical protein